MPDNNQVSRFQKSLNGGIAALVLLSILDASSEDLYGYEIAKRLADANGGTSIFKDGTIYPVLRSLAALGLLTSRIVPSYSGPPRRYYRISAPGRESLAQWQAIWRETCALVEHFQETHVATR
jgi:PadR family transcriptional regulator, regulatory protein PadR